MENFFSTLGMETGQRPDQQKRVFLCYCLEDHRYAKRLLTHFASCPSTLGLAVWGISLLQPGALWKTEIASALANAQFAVLLISADFLASPFIKTYELPHLLEAARSGGTHILPVILRPCLFEESPLAPFQAVNNPKQPLSLLSCEAREQIWVTVIRTILQLLTITFAASGRT